MALLGIVMFTSFCFNLNITQTKVKSLDARTAVVCISTHAFYDMVPLYCMQSASVLNIPYATVDIVLVGILKTFK